MGGASEEGHAGGPKDGRHSPLLSVTLTGSLAEVNRRVISQQVSDLCGWGTLLPKR